MKNENLIKFKSRDKNESDSVEKHVLIFQLIKSDTDFPQNSGIFSSVCKTTSGLAQLQFSNSASLRYT